VAYQVVTRDLSTARAGAGERVGSGIAAVYVLEADAELSLRLGDATEAAVPVAAGAGYRLAPPGDVYLVNAAGAGSVVLLLLDSTSRICAPDFLGSSAAALAAQIPGATTGLRDLWVCGGAHNTTTAPINIFREPTHQPYVHSASGGNAVNFADVTRGLFGVKLNIANAGGPANAGLVPTGAPVVNRAPNAFISALMTGTATKPGFRPGAIFWESDIAYLSAVVTAAAVSRFVLFGLGSLSDFTGFGLYFAPAAAGGSATNWVLAGADTGGAINLFAVEDTGIAAVSTTPRRLRLELGITAAGAGLARALIDGDVVAEIASFGALTTGQVDAIAKNNHAYVMQKDGANGNELEALIMTGGIRRGWIEY
jgi:hypothetical protein